MVTLEQRVVLYDTYVERRSARKCRRTFRPKFYDERVPGRKTIRTLVNKLRKTGLLIDKEQKHKRRVLTEGYWMTWGVTLEHTPRK
jgi:hypothetical protein